MKITMVNSGLKGLIRDTDNIRITYVHVETWFKTHTSLLLIIVIPTMNTMNFPPIKHDKIAVTWNAKRSSFPDLPISHLMIDYYIRSNMTEHCFQTPITYLKITRRKCHKSQRDSQLSDACIDHPLPYKWLTMDDCFVICSIGWLINW